MKLYYLPGACSMASHIVVNELQLPIEAIRVDYATHTTEHGADFMKVNPEGYVPALEFDDGTVMTESSAVMQYLADTAGSNSLLPPVGDARRYRVVELLSYLSSEIHQSLRPIARPGSDDAAKQTAVERVQSRLGRLERLLGESDFLTGADFSIADAYAFAILGAVRHFGISMDGYPRVGAYLGRLGGRPAVLATLKAEGLMA